jgi:dipeptidyl aminopeptidase/acylaminoacyl peptidase
VSGSTLKVLAIWLMTVMMTITSCSIPPIRLEPTPEGAAQPLDESTPTHIPASSVSLGRVAYILGGDVWVKQLPQGQAQRLTRDGRNRRPSWSPSGEWLAFLKNTESGSGTLWVSRADGGEQQALGHLPAGDFAWSPVDDRLAFAGNGIQVWHPGSAEPQVIVDTRQPTPDTPPRSLSATAPVWSPDGHWLAYVWQEHTADQIRQSIRKVPSEGGDATELYTSEMPDTGELIAAGWLGDRVLFWQAPILSASILADGVPLYAVPAHTSAAPDNATTDSTLDDHRIDVVADVDVVADAVLVHPDFVAIKPAGDPAVAIVEGSYRATWTDKTLLLVEAEGSRKTLSIPGQAVASPSWSPDAQKLAYTAMPDTGDLVGGEAARSGMMQRRIWMLETDDSMPHQVTNDDSFRDESPRWTRDNTHLVFARLDSENFASLWLIDIDGGEPQLIVDELTPTPEWFGYYGHIVWEDLFDVS